MKVKLLQVSLLILFVSFCFGQNEINKANDYFIVDTKIKGICLKIILPEKFDFSFLDYYSEIKLFKFADFNSDKRKDILVNVGACGTGGCMYALFINIDRNYYKLAFMDYLKNPEFGFDKSGFLMIKSSESIMPYDPSKVQVTIFRYNPKLQSYDLSEIFVFQDDK